MSILREGYCVTVAEVGNAHNGDLATAHRLLDAIKASGADYAKFQAYTPLELVELRGDGPAPDPWGSDGWTMRNLYEKAQTPLKWFPELVQHCNDIGLPWFSSVFGATSLGMLESLDCPFYKLAALDYAKAELTALVRSTGKPLIRSCADYVAAHSRRKEVMLYCPPGYPQRPVDLFGPLETYDGFSYHGTDPFVPALACVLGAGMVECHVQLDDTPSELEANVSLTTSQFADMVRMIRTGEAWA